MKNKDIEELDKKVKEGWSLLFSHEKYYDAPDAVKLTVRNCNKKGHHISGQYFLCKNVKSALLMAEEFFKSNKIVDPDDFNEPDTNLDFLIKHGFTIYISQGRSPQCDIYIKVSPEDKSDFSTDLYSRESNGIFPVLQMTEHWAAWIIQSLNGKNSARSYNRADMNEGF